MSQHWMDGRDKGVLIIVGFDPPLREFFGQVCRDGEVQEHIMGTSTLEELAEKMKRFVEIPGPVQELLLEESASMDRAIRNRVGDHRRDRERTVTSEEREI